MNSPVQKIKERLSIEEIVSSYIKLEKFGQNLKARCPFHNEKTASFFVSPDRGSYYCFGCGAKGDIFTFVEEFEGLDFKGALKLLADRAGVPLEAYTKESKEAESEKEKLYRIMNDAALFFEKNLKEKKEVLDYLKGRGLNDDSVKNFQIGFAKDDWRELYSFLNGKGWDDKIVELAGLAKRSEKGFYDRFRGRVMFPIMDSSGRVIAFSGRLFVDDGKSAKYLNSPETPIFSKYAVLYGLDKGKTSIRKNNFSILVEGQMDLVLSHQAGFKNTVATSGTALSDSTVSKDQAVSNLGLVRRISPNIVIAFDGDPAGIKATERAGKIALALGMDVKVAVIPEGVDPADMISKQGVDAWKDAVRNSRHVIEFMLEKALLSTKGDMRKAGREIKERILPFVDSLDSSIEKVYFLKKISDASGIAVSALEDDLKKVRQETKFGDSNIKQEPPALRLEGRKDYILRRLLGIILWQKAKADKKDIDSEETLAKLSEILNIPKEKIMESGSGSESDLIFEAEVFYGQGSDLNKDLKEMFSNLAEEGLKEELGRKMRDLHEAEEAKDTARSGLILKEISIISNKIQEIKSGRF